MDTAKLFKNGNSQAVRLPKGFQMPGTEVFIKRVGANVVLTPMEDPWASLVKSLDLFSDDFLEERNQPEAQEREAL